MLLALLATTVLRQRGFTVLLLTTIAVALAVAVVNWVRLHQFLSNHPTSFYPMQELWIDAAWDGLYLGLIAAGAYGATRLRWAPALQIAGAVGLAVLFPPALSLATLFIACYFFGNCP